MGTASSVSGLLLDTNVVSELTREAPDPAVSAFISSQSDLFLASVVVYEMEYGLLLLPDGRRRDNVALANSRILTAFRDRVLPLDRIGAEWAGRFRAQAQRRGRPLSVNDALIAGTAKAHALPLVTRDVNDFAGLDIEIINPWEYEAN